MPLVGLAQTGDPFPVPREIATPGADTVSRADRETSVAKLFADLGHEAVRLPSKRSAVILGIGGVLALAAHPADAELTRSATLSEPVDNALEAGELTGSGWVQAGAALGAFLVGRGSGNQRVQQVGADLVQGQIVAYAVTQGIKLTVNRRRPDGGRYSFPSGHTSSTFANATVLYRQFGWKVGLPAYVVASCVGGSRLQQNRHYASDVIFGAAVGIVAGRTVTLGRGENQFTVIPVAVPGGIGVSFTRIGATPHHRRMVDSQP